LEAFAEPKMYKELIDKHDGHAIPAELRTHLVRFHRIAEKAAPEVADSFIANARYVGAANEFNILQYRHALEKLSSTSNATSGTSAMSSGMTDSSSIPPDINQWQPVYDIPGAENTSSVLAAAANTLRNAAGGILTQNLLEEMVNTEKAKVRLTDGKIAYITYPTDIKKKDIEILRKQLDVLELLAE